MRIRGAFKANSGVNSYQDIRDRHLKGLCHSGLVVVRAIQQKKGACRLIARRKLLILKQ